MLALSIRQPFAELILRGLKSVEYRSRPTRVIGRRFWIYVPKATKRRGDGATKGIWSSDLSNIPGPLPEWMIELARQVRMLPPDADLPTGVIVGSAVVERVSRADDGMWRWHLAGVERARRLRRPTGRPQPVWFTPF